MKHIYDVLAGEREAMKYANPNGLWCRVRIPLMPDARYGSGGWWEMRTAYDWYETIRRPQLVGCLYAMDMAANAVWREEEG